MLTRGSGRLRGGALLLALTAACAPAPAPKPAAPIDALRETVRLRVRSVNACYEAALVSSPGLAAVVVVKVVEIVVTPEGTVSSVKVKSSLKTPHLTACMMQRIKAWRFPPRAGESAALTFRVVLRTAPDEPVQRRG